MRCPGPKGNKEEKDKRPEQRLSSLPSYLGLQRWEAAETEDRNRRQELPFQNWGREAGGVSGCRRGGTSPQIPCVVYQMGKASWAPRAVQSSLTTLETGQMLTVSAQCLGLQPQVSIPGNSGPQASGRVQKVAKLFQL